MPKQYTYKGDPVDLGRFGFVKTGDVVDLYVHEELCVLDHPDYEPVSGPTKPVNVPLLGTPAVDLRTLPWDNLRQLQHDLGNYHQARLSTLVAAMNLVGLDVNYFDSQPPRDVVDDVIRAARSAGWHLLTREERHACGVYTEAAEEQEEVVAQPAEPEASDEGESETSTDGQEDEAQPTQPKTRRGRRS
jgi:hypothetical protein